MMYNLPGQRRETWQRDLERLHHLDVRHFTVYRYRIHEGTPQHKFIQLGKTPPIRVKDSQYVKDMYNDVVETAATMGFHMYMFDYFARPGWEAKYLSWMIRNSHVELLGIGPGAYGYINNYRLAVGKNVEEYVATIDRGGHLISAASPQLTLQARKERFVSNLLQCMAIDRAEYRHAFGTDLLDDFPVDVTHMIDQGLATLDTSELRLTSLGREWHQQGIAYDRSHSGMSRSLLPGRRSVSLHDSTST
jgi:oxygen-independent coproporphyrinogen-3 oxidase